VNILTVNQIRPTHSVKDSSQMHPRYLIHKTYAYHMIMCENSSIISLVFSYKLQYTFTGTHWIGLRYVLKVTIGAQPCDFKHMAHH